MLALSGMEGGQIDLPRSSFQFLNGLIYAYAIQQLLQKI